MNWYLVGGVAVFILVVGSLIALVWWNLAAKMAPYEDERGARRDPRQRSRDPGQQDNSVIVPWTAATTSALDQPSQNDSRGADSGSHHRRGGHHDSPADRTPEPDRAERETSNWSDAPEWNDTGAGSDSGGGGAFDSGGGSDSGGGGDSGGGSGGSSD